MRHRFLALDEDRVRLDADVLLDRHALVFEITKRFFRFDQLPVQSFDRLT